MFDGNFNGNATIDPFNRVESPLSDSGQWWSPMIGGGTTPGLGNDYQETHQFPFVGSNVSIKHQDWDHVLSPFPGPAYAIRLTNPGPAANQQISLFGTGLFGIAYQLLHFDLFGNGYVLQAQNSGAGTSFSVYRSDAWSKTLIAYNNLPAVSAGNLYIGSNATDDVLSMWYRDVFESTSGPYHLGVSVTDSTYPTGFLGFGGEGGVFGSFSQGSCGGLSPTSTTTPRGVYTPSILIPYLRPTVHT